MFLPSLWSSSRPVSNKIVVNPTLSPPPQTQQHRCQQPQPSLHRDIEAATEQILTPVFVQPKSSSSQQQRQLSLSPGTGNSITGTSSRTYQQDGDPFHRRSGASTHSNIGDGSGDTSVSSMTSSTSQLQLQQQALSTTITPYSDATLSNNNIRGSDVLIPVADNSSSLLPRSVTVLRGGGTSSKVVPDPKLIHPSLLRIPLHIRFALNGFVCNILFMLAYNYAALMFERTIAVSTIYSIVYFIFIPLGHVFVSLFVFGWPERYIASLMNNFPIGLSAIAIGSVLTGYLDSINFTELVDEFIRDNFIFFKMPPRLNADGTIEGEVSQFWSSLVVLFVTSLWTYGLSIYINTTPTISEKKEL